MFTHIIRAIVLAAARRGVGRSAALLLAAVGAAGLMSAPTLAQGNGGHSVSVSSAVDGAVNNFQPGEDVVVTLSITSDISQYFNATLGGHRYKAVSDGVDLDTAIGGWRRTSPVTFNSCGPAPLSSGTSDIQVANLVVAPAPDQGFSTLSCVISFNATIPSDATPGSYTLNTDTLNGTYTRVDDPNTAGDQSVGDTAFTFAPVSYAFDIIADQVPSVSLSGPGGVLANAPFTVTATFSEPVTGLTSGEITVTGGSVTNVTAIGGGEGGGSVNWQIEITPSGTGTVNVTVQANAAEDGLNQGNTASDLSAFTIGSPPTLTASIIGNPAAPGGALTVRFVLTNTDSSNALSAGQFTIDVDSSLAGTTVTSVPAGGFCGGSSSAVNAGNGVAVFSSLGLAASGSCTFDVPLAIGAGAAGGTYPITVTGLSYSLGGVSSSINVLAPSLQISGAEGAGAPASFTKTFLSASAARGGTIDVRYDVFAPELEGLTAISFTDDFDAALSGLTAISLPGADICGAGSSLTGTSTMTLAGGTLAAGGSCSFTVTLQLPATGTGGTITSTTSGLAGTADSGAVNLAGVSDSFLLPILAPGVLITGPSANRGVGLPFELTVTFSEPVTGFSQAGFTLVTNAALSNFTADSATVYTVDVTPAAAGAVEIGIGADQAFDTDTNGNIASQTYQVQAVAAEGDLDVAFNGQLIVDASAVISDALGTRFAPLDPSAGAVVRTYTITNSGTGPVNLTGGAGSQVVLTNGTAFTVSAQPGDTALAAGESTTFALSFDPGSVAVFNDTVTIAHDAPNEAPYDFAIQGEGVTAPELDVSGNGVAIANNDLTPQSADLTDFGTINAGTFRIRTYGLQNTGGSDLIFDATPVTILNDSAGVFTVSSQPAGPIASGSFADMTIRFFSADAGNYSALVSIASNDADEDPYQFQIQAQATGVQEVELQGNSLEIVAGDSSASVADDTDFSGVKVGETATATFTIRNTGTTPLALSPAPVERDGPGTAGTTTVDVVGGSSDFTITSQPAASVTAGGSTTFTVQYSPSAAGAATATLAFGTDDLDEPRYAFTVAGLGTVPEIAVAGLGGADIANTDATPEAGDGTDFGATGFSAGAPITRTFTITNSGDAVLALGANAVSLSGAGVGDWTVTTQPATTVAPNGGTTTFEISFDPTEQLVRTATVSIANDDANEAPFTFAVQGTGADDAAPAGYTASFDQGVVNAANQGAISFTFAGGEAQADYAYTISSSGGGAAVTGGGTLATSTDTIAGLDLSSLTDGLLTLSVTLTDNAANQGAAATATVTKDVGAPGVSITTASSDPVSGAFTATFTFTEAVTGFTLGDIAVGNGAASSFSTTSASVYTATITPAANGAVTVDVAAAAAIDAAGNANTAAAQFSITNDATAPGLAITTASSDPVSGAFTATFTFTEAVTGFTLGDIAVGNGAASSLSTTSASVYTATITPAANGAVTVDVPAAAANDAAGNANTAAAQFSITNDATAPGLAITTASSDPVSGAFTATFTFTEAVTGFVLGDIAVGNGAASSFSTTSPSVYTATITPAADGAVTVDVAANAANDAAGNANTAATQFSITRDATAPTITFTADPVAPVINGGQVQLTVTFSESVTGFDATDLNVVNGAVEGFSGSGAVYIINVRPVADGPFSVGVGAGAAVDGAGNGNIANQYSVTADLTAPTATISSTASDPVSGVFSISVAFSEPVTGFEASSLTVGNGSASNVAGGGAAYTADITPGADGPVTVDLPANAVLDVASNGNVAPAQFTIQADGTVPGVSITSGSSDPVSGAFAITVTFTEAVTGFVLGDIAVGNGAASSFSTTSQSVYTATITPAAEGAVTVDVPPAAATDAAGNANTAAAQLIRQNDVTAPGLAITTASSNPVSGAFTATFTFTESVTGFALGDIAVGNGAASSLAGSGAAYTATITPAADGTVTVDVPAAAANDAAGNANTAAAQFSITNDAVAPGIAITTASSNPVSGAFTATFTFSEAVTGFVLGDIAVGNGAASNLAGSGAVYTANITPAADGAVTVDVAAAAANDAAGNANTAATQFSITNDAAAPSLAITTASPNPVSGAFTATFTFTESVTGFVLGDIAVGNGAATNFAGSGAVYTATITPAANGVVTVDVAAAAAADAAGNTSLAAAQLSITNDATAPGLAITTASTNPVSGAFTATFTFTESVTGFALGDIAVGNGAASNLAGSGAVYTATITPAANGAVTVDVAAAAAIDAAGNASLAAAQFSITNDATAPGLAITTASSDPVSGAFTATFTFTEAVTGFALGDIAVGNGAASSLAGSGAVYTATITPAADGAVTVDVAAAAANDAAGNANTAAAQFSITNDATAPGLAITTASSDPVSGAFTATFTFTESVTGFVLGDIAVGNGAASNLAGSGAVYTATITPAAEGAVTVDVAAAAAVDTAGNASLAAAQLIRQNDATAPTVALSSTATGPVSGAFTLAITFSEPVTGLALADFAVTNGAGSELAGSGAAYTLTVTPAADGPVVVNLPAAAAADAAGNASAAAEAFTIQNDGSAPQVASLVVSDTDLRLDNVGDTFTLTVTFSEPLSAAAAGTVTFDADLSSTLSTTVGALNDARTAYVLTATVLDGGQSLAGVKVSVAGFADAAGNTLTPFEQTGAFAVDMRRAGLTVSVAINGSIDETFAFTGGLGAFDITTSGQTGEASFNTLAEGSYAFAITDVDGFTLDSVSCTGVTNQTDSAAGTASVTLAPGDTGACVFAVEAEAGVDPDIQVSVPITLPSDFTDPASVSAQFPLTNVGASPLTFRVEVDVDWLDITPAEGSIPAGGTAVFTVAFNDNVLALDAGTYDATIRIFNLSGSSTPSGSIGTQAVRTQTIAIPVTVQIVERLGSLTLITTTAPDVAGDDDFGFTSDIAAVDGRTLSTVNGTSRLGPLEVTRGQYSIRQTVPEGWRLQSISCAGDSDGGSSFDVANASVALDLDPNENLTCTFANVRDEAYVQRITTTAIRDFMAQRADQLLTMSPSIGDRLRRGRAQAANGFSADFTEGRFDSAFALSLSGMREMGREGDPFADEDEPAYAGFDFSNAGAPGVIDVWVQASYSGVEDNRAGLSSSNRFGLVYLGADMMINEDLLAGVLIQYDRMETTTGELRSEVEGDGWMAGPYMAMRIGENLYFDARGAWGRSDNTIDPLGLYVDDFETDRWLLEANLAGEIFRGNWRITPEAGLAWFSEDSGAYTDSLGFAIPGQSVTLGRLRFGPEFAYRFVKSEKAYIEPYMSLQAIYNFDQAEVINATGFLEGLSEFRADARVGLNAAFDNGARLSGEITLNGLGDGEFDATSAMIRLRTPLSMP